jgi:hypothetical protein
MQDPEVISDSLEAVSDGHTARKRARQVQPFRGVRGVAPKDVTRILVSTWQASPLQLPDDEELLQTLFMTAFEDGLVAVGLLAAALPDAPVDVLDMADELLPHVDDTETADALGWLVLGPGLLATGEGLADGVLALKDAPPHRRRAAVMALMTALPEPVQGGAAAALRERMKNRQVVFVEAPLSDEIERALVAYLRDTSPVVRKAVARVLRAWGTFDPDRVEALIQTFPGGMSKQLREEAVRGIRKARRPERKRTPKRTDDDDFGDIEV